MLGHRERVLEGAQGVWVCVWSWSKGGGELIGDPLQKAALEVYVGQEATHACFVGSVACW